MVPQKTGNDGKEAATMATKLRSIWWQLVKLQNFFIHRSQKVMSDIHEESVCSMMMTSVNNGFGFVGASLLVVEGHKIWQ